MRLGATMSVGLHAVVIALAWFGLPHLRSDPPELDEIVFVKLADLGDVTNVPPETSEPKREKPEPEPKPPKAKPPKAKPPKAKPPKASPKTSSNRAPSPLVKQRRLHKILKLT